MREHHAVDILKDNLHKTVQIKTRILPTQQYDQDLQFSAPFAIQPADGQQLTQCILVDSSTVSCWIITFVI